MNQEESIHEDVMDLVHRLREGAVAGHTLSPSYWKITDAEAVALIEALCRRVPKTMLDAIFTAGMYSAFNLPDEMIRDIANRYGVHIEEAKP